MRYKQFLNEANTTKALNMEKRIVDAWNDGTIDPELQKIVDYLKEQGVKGSAHHISKKYDVTEEWNTYHQGNIKKSNPKTDLIIGRHRISLKTGKKYQLAGPRRDDSIAIFHSAVKLSAIDPTNKIIKELDKSLNSLVKRGTIFDTIKKTRGSDILLDEASLINDKVQQILDDTFAKNDRLKQYYIYELLSGKIKFGDDSLARATHVLNVSFDGTNTKLSSIDDKSYIKDVSDKCRFNVSFESSSVRTKKAKPGQRIWKTLIRIMNEGSIVLKIKNFFSQIISKIKGNVFNVFEIFNIKPKIDISF